MRWAKPVLLSLLLFSGCSQTQENPVELEFGMYSKSTPEEVRDRVAKAGASYEVINDQKLSNGDSRPRHDFLVVKLSNYSKDADGELRVMFYNQELMGVVFYPKDWGTYKVFLKKKLADENLDIGFDRVKNNLHVSVAKDFKGQVYVLWEDVKISNAVSKWVDKYASTQRDAATPRG